MYLIHSIGTCWPAYSWISPSSAHNPCPNVRETHAIQLWLYKSYIIISLLFTPIFPLQKSVDGACNTCQHDSSPLRWRSLFPATSPLTCASSAGQWCSLEGCPAPSLRHHGKGTMESNDSLGEMSLVRWASGMLTTRFQACITRTPAASHCSMLPR